MKHIRKILVLLVLLIPISVNALENNYFTVIGGDNVTSENDVKGSSILVGNNVVSTNTVNGINMVFGNSVKHQSNSDYAVVVGNIVEVSGNIENDGFIFGNIITFTEDFSANRDLFVFGSEVTLKGNINRNITIYAANVVLDNAEVLGNVTIYSTTLEIKDAVSINGVLSYNEDNETNISTNAQINETKLLDKLEKEPTINDIAYNFFVGYADVMIVFLILAFLVPGLFRKIETSNEEFKLSKVFSLLGYGAMLLIGIPMALIVLFTTVIGMSSAIIGLLIYIIAVCLANILTGYLIGYLIWNKFIKKENNILLIGLIGISIISVLNIVPVLGEYITVFSLMIGLGIVLQLFKRNK